MAGGGLLQWEPAVDDGLDFAPSEEVKQRGQVLAKLVAHGRQNPQWTTGRALETIVPACPKLSPVLCSGVLTLTQHHLSRRGFLTTSATTLAALGTVANVHAAGSDVLRVGLIGCGSERGGRGRGAAANCVNAGEGVRLVA